ncbi:MAG: universal stress protein [Actinobacteria bacterium]|nr:universal stress protein [Actinomycetota bacterium]
MFQTIMVATDGSHSAERAVEFAVDFAKRHDSKLVICTVTNQRLVKTTATEPSSASDAECVLCELSDIGAEVLRRAEQVAKSAGLKDYELTEAYGTNIGATIVAQAEAVGADHLVVASLGTTGLSRLLLGSVAASVIHHAHCPVTVVR